MPYKDLTKRRQYRRNYNRKWRAEHKRLGLCLDCSESVKVGYVYCAKHLFSHYKGYEMRMRSLNRCIHCGAPLIDDENRYCTACRSWWHTPIIKGVIEYGVVE